VSTCEEKGLAMPLLQILMVLSAVVVLFWLVDRFIPLKGTIKSFLNAVVWNRGHEQSEAKELVVCVAGDKPQTVPGD
jgi:hypothetical protein